MESVDWLKFCVYYLGSLVSGSIPGAVIFGFAIDRTCALWKEECGEVQSCIRYDSDGLSTAMLAFGKQLVKDVV